MAASRQRHHRSARSGHLRTSGDSNNEPGACYMSQREQRPRRALTTLLTAGRYAPAARTASGVSAANTVTALEAPVSTPSQPSRTGHSRCEMIAKPAARVDRPRNRAPTAPAAAWNPANPLQAAAAAPGSLAARSTKVGTPSHRPSGTRLCAAMPMMPNYRVAAARVGAVDPSLVARPTVNMVTNTRLIAIPRRNPACRPGTPVGGPAARPAEGTHQRPARRR
jgi:hypothetical protein